MFDPFLSDYRPQDNSRVAVFGEIGGQKSLADLQDLLASVRYRMTQMAAALGSVNPMLVKDPKAFAALMVDAGNLKTRVDKADVFATQLISNNAVPLSYAPAQHAFDLLMKAIKQGYPPDGARVQRGDLDDVINRIGQVGGVRVDLSQMPQPQAHDVDRTIIQNLPPRLPDIPKPRELDWLEDVYRFVKDHEKEILVLSVVAGGFFLWHMAPHVLPAAKMAGKALILA